MTGDLTQRQRDFLQAAYLAAWRDGRIFKPGLVCEWLEMVDDCPRIVRDLEKAGLLDNLPDGEAILTDRGRAMGAALGSN